MVISSHSKSHTYTNGPNKYPLVLGYKTVTRLFCSILLLSSWLLLNHNGQKRKFLLCGISVAVTNPTHTQSFIFGNRHSNNNKNKEQSLCSIHWPNFSGIGLDPNDSAKDGRSWDYLRSIHNLDFTSKLIHLIKCLWYSQLSRIRAVSSAGRAVDS